MNRRSSHLQKTTKTRKVEWFCSAFFAPSSRRWAKRMVAKAARREDCPNRLRQIAERA